MLVYCFRICILYDLHDTKYEEGTNVCLMSFCQELSLPFFAILTHQKLLCVFMVLPLNVSMMSKAMETEMVVMKAGRDISGLWIESGRYHSLKSTDEMETKAYISNHITIEKNIINKLVNVKNIFKQQYTNSQEHSNVVFQNALVVSNKSIYK